MVQKINEENIQFVKKLEYIKATVPSQDTVKVISTEQQQYKKLVALYPNGKKKVDPLIHKKMKSMIEKDYAQSPLSQRSQKQTDLNLPTIISQAIRLESLKQGENKNMNKPQTLNNSPIQQRSQLDNTLVYIGTEENLKGKNKGETRIHPLRLSKNLQSQNKNHQYFTTRSQSVSKSTIADNKKMQSVDPDYLINSQTKINTINGMQTQRIPSEQNISKNANQNEEDDYQEYQELQEFSVGYKQGKQTKGTKGGGKAINQDLQDELVPVKVKKLANPEFHNSSNNQIVMQDHSNKVFQQMKLDLQT